MAGRWKVESTESHSRTVAVSKGNARLVVLTRASGGEEIKVEALTPLQRDSVLIRRGRYAPASIPLEQLREAINEIGKDINS